MKSNTAVKKDQTLILPELIRVGLLLIVIAITKTYVPTACLICSIL